MHGPRRLVRQAAVAGQFYPAGDRQCMTAAASLVRASGPATGGEQRIGDRWIGAIVPHAGWICSGAVAGEAIGTLRQTTDADVVVVFGAVHTPLPIDRAVLASFDAWQVPGVEIAQSELSAKLAVDSPAQSGGLFVVNDRFHDREHAVEVELPLVAQAWRGASIVPVEVPLIDEAAEIGIRVARAVSAENLRAVYLASSDLTHYGPAYRFTPLGVGDAGLAWAKENDRLLLSAVTELAVERIVPHVREHWNACGGGAIAAMLAAAREHGATRGKVLRQTNSYDVLRAIAPQSSDNAVGYAGVVIG